MKSRCLLALIPCLALGGLLLGAHAVGCEAQPFYDAKEGALSCDWENQGHDLLCILKEGTYCDRGSGFCKCPDEQEYCRQRTPFGECEGTARCRPRAECQPQCATPSDCVQPPDPRCGAATCSEGVCGLVFFPGPAKSQVRGDCKTIYCDTAGNASEKEDLGDFPNDGKECTRDTCNMGGPENLPYPMGLPCPETFLGVCYQGECVECAATAPVNYCDSPLACDDVYCVDNACVVAGKCGGACRPCGVGFPCSVASDCKSGVCQAGSCALPTCTDGVKNGSETGIDCGGPTCAKRCADGVGCTAPEHCVSGVCWGGVCQEPTCIDTVMNGDETAADCGGSCEPCPP